MIETPEAIEKRQKIQEIIKRELSKVNRPGIEQLINYMDENGFYIAPAASSFHLAYPGGLAEHSWNVYQVLITMLKEWSEKFSEESLIIVGLLHDFCKIKLYKIVNKWVKNSDGVWLNEECYEHNYEHFPVGHGEKSVIMLQNFLRLKQEEILAIRWHMSSFAPGFDSMETQKQFNAAKRQTNLVALLILADLMSAWVIEK